jgi:hypothetical protein
MNFQIKTRKPGNTSKFTSGDSSHRLVHLNAVPIDAVSAAKLFGCAADQQQHQDGEGVAGNRARLRAAIKDAKQQVHASPISSCPSREANHQDETGQPQ